MTENLNLSSQQVRFLVERIFSQRNAILEQMQLIDRPAEIDGRMDWIRSNKEMLKSIQMWKFKLHPKFKPETPYLHSRAAYDRPETIKTAKLPPISEVVWQQPLETYINRYNLNIVYNYSTTQNDRIIKRLTWRL